MDNIIQKAPRKVNGPRLSIPLGIDSPHKVAQEHLIGEIKLRRDRLKTIESKGEPVPIEILVELEAFQRELIRYREGIK